MTSLNRKIIIIITIIITIEKLRREMGRRGIVEVAGGVV